MNENVWPLILLGGGLLAFLLAVSFLSKNYSLNNFKSKTVGDGQHGTARWATPKEITRPIMWSRSVLAAGARERNCLRCRASFSAAWAAESAEPKEV